MQAAPVEVGDILAGKYRIEKVLGQGGMGIVVAATNIMLDKKVALKFMLGAAAASKEFTARFLREAKTAASLDTQHVAKVLDVGLLDDGAPFMVLEHLNGTDLLAIIEANGPVPVEYACEYIMQAAVGMAEAHTKGIIHRDLKPANLFLTTAEDGRTLVKILDFGIAKAAIDSLATKTQALMGAPLYMSAEQMRSAKNVDARADIWSLGASLYHLLTGKPPFQADTMPLLCLAILQDPPTPFDDAAVQVPEALQQIVLRCMEKALDDRPQSAFELAALLAPFSVARPTINAASNTKSARTKPEAVAVPLAEAQSMASRYGVTTLSSSTSEMPAVDAGMPPARPANRRWLYLGVGATALTGAALIVVPRISADATSANAEVTTPPAAVKAPVEELPAPAPVPVKEMAMLKISTDPPGAEIFVNDESIGESPLAIQRELASTQSLRIVSDGYESIEADVTIEALVHELKFSMKKVSRSEERRRKRREAKAGTK